MHRNTPRSPSMSVDLGARLAKARARTHVQITKGHADRPAQAHDSSVDRYG
jgi:hypothetical protein